MIGVTPDLVVLEDTQHGDDHHIDRFRHYQHSHQWERQFDNHHSHLNDRLSLRVAANGRHYFEDSTQEFFSTPTFNNRYNPATGALTQDLTWAPDPASGRYVATPSPFFDPRSEEHTSELQSH